MYIQKIVLIIDYYKSCIIYSHQLDQVHKCPMHMLNRILKCITPIRMCVFKLVQNSIGTYLAHYKIHIVGKFALKQSIK